MASAAKRHRHSACALGVVLVFAIAGCSSSSSSSGSTTTSTKVDKALLGPAKAATGSELTLGYISDGKTAAVDGSVDAPAREAAVKYVNEHLGGVAGRPIKLKVCDTGITPSGAKDCVNQMIAAKVPAVLENVSGVAGPIAKGLEADDVPLFVYVTGDQDTLLSPNSNVMTNTLAGLAGPIQLAKDSGAKRAAIVVIDVPAAAGPLEALAAPLYKKAGIDVDFVPVAQGTPDMTPQVQSELAKDPDQIEIIGDPPFCTSALKALKTLGYTKRIIVIPQCITAETAKGIPGGLAGVTLLATESTDPKDPEVALYNAAMATYEPDAEAHFGITSGGWAVVVGFARAMSHLSGDVTPASVRSALLTSGPQQLPLLGSGTFSCDRKQMTLTPAVCSQGAVIAELDKAGNAKTTKPFDATSVLSG
jgi:branched-chain amino acid transport system substrate-binding protein